MRRLIVFLILLGMVNVAHAATVFKATANVRQLAEQLKNAHPPEKPPLPRSRARAYAWFVLNDKQDTLKILIKFNSKIDVNGRRTRREKGDNLKRAHIHKGRRGQDGPVKFFIVDPKDKANSGVTDDDTITGRRWIIGKWDGLNKKIVKRLMHNGYFCDFHTVRSEEIADAAEAEIRGQIRLVGDAHIPREIRNLLDLDSDVEAVKAEADPEDPEDQEGMEDDEANPEDPEDQERTENDEADPDDPEYQERTENDES